MATIQDVARLAGVSTATVSRVLNDNYKVSEKRRKLVLDAVEQLGYRPNIVGRNLSRSENKTILVVSAWIHDDMLHGAAAAARELGYDMVLSYSPDEDDKDALKYFENGLAGGIIFINFRGSDSRIAELCSKYPVVQCAEYVDTPDACLVSVRNGEAIGELVDMLAAQGRKRFAFIAPASRPGITIHYAEAREQGFRKGLAKNGLDINEDFIVRFPLEGRDYEKVEAVAESWLAMPEDERPDAVICASDTIAVFCLNRLQRGGLRVPQDVAITGFDDRRAIYTYPKITSVSQPFFEMGAGSVRMLAEIMSGNEPENRRVYLPHKIVVRGSTDESLD